MYPYGYPLPPGYSTQPSYPSPYPQIGLQGPPYPVRPTEPPPPYYNNNIPQAGQPLLRVVPAGIAVSAPSAHDCNRQLKFATVALLLIAVLAGAGYAIYHFAFSSSSSSSPTNNTSGAQSSSTGGGIGSNNTHDVPVGGASSLYPVLDSSALVYLSASSLPLSTVLSVWADLSPQQNNFIQSNSASSPTTRVASPTSYNGVYFTQSQSFMTSTFSTFPVGTDYSLLIIAAIVPAYGSACTLPTTSYVVGSAANGHSFVIGAGTSNGVINALHGGVPVTNFPSLTVACNTITMMEMVYAGSSKQGSFYTNAVNSEQFTASNSVTENTITLGASAGVASFQGYIFEVMLFGSALNDSYRGYLESFFASKYVGL